MTHRLAFSSLQIFSSSTALSYAICLVFLSRIAKLREACFDPGSVMNGTRLGGDYKLGSTVTFHCDPGYQLQGYSSLTCVMGGTNRPEWNRALPSCQGTLTFPSVLCLEQPLTTQIPALHSIFGAVWDTVPVCPFYPTAVLLVNESQNCTGVFMYSKTLITFEKNQFKNTFCKSINCILENCHVLDSK